MAITTRALNTESQQPVLSEEQKKQNVIRVVALGWSVVELLGRCFTLKLPTPEQKLKNNWNGERMIMISPAINSQKRLKALVCFVQSIVEKLDLIDGQDASDKCVLDTLHDNIEKLYLLDARDNTLLGQINECLFSWDIKIRERLQNKSEQFRNNYDYVNAYIVGKSFAALRWYHELPVEKQAGNASIPASIAPAISIDECFLATLEERVQLLTPYLDTFAPLALAKSIKRWEKALLKQKIFDSKGDISSQLKHQADIWYDLLTAERDPVTYVTPSSVSWRYTSKVIFFALPYVFLGIVLALGITVLIAYLIGALWPSIAKVLNTSTTGSATIAAIGTGFSLLAGIATSIPATKALWQWVTHRAQAGAESASSEAVKSLVDVFWEASQQDAINQATYVKHRGLSPRYRTSQ
jgi:hypothetical protein